MSARSSLIVRPLLALAFAALLASCGGGGGTIPATGVQLRPLSADFLTRKAVAYSPYRAATCTDSSQCAISIQNEPINPADIKADMLLLIQGGYTLLRLFDSSDKVAKQTLQVIKDNNFDIKVQLGAYVQSGDDAFNQQEIARAIKLANDFKDIVRAVSVGNETMVSWSFNKVSESVMAGYITQVRNAITQPVTTDDNFALYALAPRKIMDVIDFASIHTYPLLDTPFIAANAIWDWRQLDKPAATRATSMMDAALQKAQKDYNAARAALDSVGQSAMPIIIGETGWKAEPNGGETGRAHQVNQKMYLDRLNAWSAATKNSGGPKAIFYFEAFDEKWKGSDNGFGLFTGAREARYAIKASFPASQVDAAAKTYTDGSATYAVPLNVRAVSSNRYTIYADTASAGEAKPVTGTWNGWLDGNNLTAFPDYLNTEASAEGLFSTKLILSPAAWGWGIFLPLPDNTSDALAGFGATGSLNFSIKTDYPGRIEVGFAGGSVMDGSTVYEAYMPIFTGDYGYKNDNTWRQVSIPISVLVNYAVASANADPAAIKQITATDIDLSKVVTPFVIADRYAKTFKPSGSGFKNKIYVDNIYWSK